MATWESTGPRSVKSVQAPSGEEPPSGSAGLLIDAVGGFSLHLACDEGHTFTAAAGKLAAWIQNPKTKRWSRSMDSSLDVAITLKAVGQGELVWSNFPVNVPAGRIAHVAEGMALSGGELTLHYVATGHHGPAVVL